MLQLFDGALESPPCRLGRTTAEGQDCKHAENENL